MATIYHGTIKTVSPFISLSPSEIKTVILDALKDYIHRTGLRLESTEVEIVKDSPDNLQEKSRLEGVILGLELALKTWGESGDTFTALMENKKYYQEELKMLEE